MHRSFMPAILPLTALSLLALCTLVVGSGSHPLQAASSEHAGKGCLISASVLTSLQGVEDASLEVRSVVLIDEDSSQITRYSFLAITVTFADELVYHGKALLGERSATHALERMALFVCDPQQAHPRCTAMARCSALLQMGAATVMRGFCVVSHYL